MSMIGKSRYKETKAGWLPMDWSAVEMQEIGNIIRGASPRPQGDPRYYGGNVPRLMGADVTRDGKWVTPKIDFLTEAGAKLSRPCAKGTLTITCSGDVGIPAFLAVDACIHDGFLALIGINKSKINNDFLYHVIFSLKQRFDSSATHGGVFTNLTTSILKEFCIPAPTLPEQEKIAAILTTVDDKLDVISRQIEATQSLKQGLMQILFCKGVGTEEVIGCWKPHTKFKKILSLNVPATWDVKRLGDIAPLIRRPVEINPDASYPELGLRSYGKGTFHKPALLGTEVGNKRLFEIKAGDLLFSNVFAWEGAVAVAKPEDDGRFGSHRYITCKVDATQADTSYLLRYLTTPIGITSLTLASPGGAGRNKTLGLTALANIEMPLPPLAEQQKISQILDGVDAKIAVLLSKQKHYQALKRGLMQKLLTGEWRVSLDPQAPPTETAHTA